jgi:DNA primase
MSDAIDFIKKLLSNDIGIDSAQYSIKKQPKRLQDMLRSDAPIISITEESELDNLDMNHSYMRERGFTESILKYNSVGYYAGHNDYSFMRRRIIFPVRTIDGKIAGFTGRSIIDNAEERKQQGITKWLHSSGLHKYESFPKSYLVYNVHDAKKSPKRESIIVVEGPIDVLRLQQFGIMNVVAIFGTSMNRHQEMLIRQTGARVLIPLFDDDDAGHRARLGMQNRFGKRDIISIRNIDLPKGKDPGDLLEEEVQELLHEFIE